MESTTYSFDREQLSTRIGEILSSPTAQSGISVPTANVQLGSSLLAEGTIKVEEKPEGNRFSGADWADQKKEIIVVGVGGIGSWLCLNLARIGHMLHLFDPDIVDESNVHGGQMYRSSSIGRTKVNEVIRTCREFGCGQNTMYAVDDVYSKFSGVLPIIMTGLDNMVGRKTVFQEWKRDLMKQIEEDRGQYLLVDGRLLMESAEIFTIRGDKPEDMDKYEKEHLFDDKDVPDLDCTTKQTTFGAMLIASMMTATLCNFLTNRKIGEDFREVPFYQRFYLPIMDYKKEVV